MSVVPIKRPAEPTVSDRLATARAELARAATDQLTQAEASLAETCRLFAEMAEADSVQPVGIRAIARTEAERLAHVLLNIRSLADRNR